MTNSASRTLAVLEIVAETEGTDPLDLPPLYDAVDTDALESIFGQQPHGGPRTGRIEFPYHGHNVSVACAADGTVTVDAHNRSARAWSGQAEAERGFD